MRRLLDAAQRGSPSTPGHRIRFTAIAALIILTALRLLVAATTPLSPDEAYYWVWSRALAPGYLDHPPMVALWIRIGTAIAGESPLGVRLLAPIAAAIGTILLADAARALFPDRKTALPAAILLNATIMFTVGAVTMTPDTPLLFFWTATLWTLARLLASGTGAWWLATGLAAGLALDSKYTAALLGLAALLWLLTPGMRPWLRTPWPWAGGAIAALLFSPVLAWNAAHGWASFLKQGGRAADWVPANALRYTAELIGGQAGLATPLTATLFILGIAAAARRWRDPAFALLLALTLPGAILFLQHALGDRVQANWVAILYPGAALAAAALHARWWRPAAALGVACSAAITLQAVHPWPLPAGIDPTARLAGWSGLAQSAGTLARQHGAGFIASEEYGPAALLAWNHPGLPIVAAGPRWSLFDLPPLDHVGPGLLIISSRRQNLPDPAIWQSVILLGTVDRTRGRSPVETFRIYQVQPLPNPRAVLLPVRHILP